jgi:peroxiredoxin
LEGNKDGNGITIEGKFKNLKNEMIYIKKITGNQLVTLDSTLSKNGKFELHINYEEPMFYILQVDNSNQFVYLIVDSTDKDIKVTGDAKNLVFTYEVKGSKQSEIAKPMIVHNARSIMKVDSIGKIYQDYMKNNPSKLDSVKKSLDQVYYKIYNDEKTFLTNFISQNKGSFAALLALYQQLGPRNYIFNPQKDLKTFEMVDKALMEKYPNSTHARNLHTLVIQTKEEIKKQKMMQKSGWIGKEAPDIAYPGPDGKIYKLSDLRGKYVLLDFWASWCAPCRRESPNLVANYNKYHSKGFEIFQVSLDRNKDSWIKAIKDDHLDKWYHVSDLKYWSSEPAKLYGVRAIPSNFLIDKNGKIIATNLRGQRLGEKLKEIFGE